MAIQGATEGGEVDTEMFTYTVNDEDETVSVCESINDCETGKLEGDNLVRTLTNKECIITLVYRKS